MHLLQKLSRNPKKAAATAAGAFVVANPIISAFIIGLGVAIYLSVRQRPSY